MATVFNEKLKFYKNRIKVLIETELSKINKTNRLIESVKYSLNNQGKCIRSALLYEIGSSLNASLEQLDVAAVAIELIHTYSLIHDDLPSMDNDTIRRGQNTLHIEFDEATAILAGDSILTLVFEILSRTNQHLKPETQIKLINTTAQRIGYQGMCSGQSLDLHPPANIDIKYLKQSHRLKTSYLIICAAELACIIGGASSEKTKHIIDFADKIGLAFQIQDDILDLQANTKQIGKDSCSDIKNNRNTYPKVIGLEQSTALAQKYILEANQIIKEINLNTDFTQQLLEFIIHRTR